MVSLHQGARLTYAELLRQADAVARGLLALGVQARAALQATSLTGRCCAWQRRQAGPAACGWQPSGRLGWGVPLDSRIKAAAYEAALGASWAAC